MSIRLLVASLLSSLALVGGVSAVAPAGAATAHAAASGGVSARVSCTLTSTHHCIRGGQFCPRASYGRSGWDAYGRRYVCKGSRVHPHWMRP